MADALHAALFRLSPRRLRLAAAARGTVLEVGGGLNLPEYRGVERVVVVDASDDLSSLEPESFDTAVCTFALCTARDPVGLLRTLRRLLRTDGRLLFLEHVRGGGLRSVLQRAARPVWQRVFRGCRPDRDPVASIRDAGFLITDLDRFTIRMAAPIVSPAVQGVAKKKAA